ncbi:MAG TPA: FAD-binding oxidoreductase [Blastocatellia bacterium]|nr:FAD-binding oxidoreductase [Blastocatellia bacterium]
MADPQLLAGRLEHIVGRAGVSEGRGVTVDGPRPMIFVRPSAAEEAASCLAVCSEVNAAVIPAGLMTWLGGGNRVRRADVVLSTERMNRIIEYSPPDLTATVQAGVTLEALNAVARRERQWLPLDAPGGGRVTLGALAACASSGPLRLMFGTPRDYVIGLRLAHADGSESRAGGKVVKNVAGYDMCKLYVGSFGTLAVLTELTFKLRPLPECSATVAVTSKEVGALLALSAGVQASELQPASLFITNVVAEEAPQTKATDHVLLVRFAEEEAAVKHQVAGLIRLMGNECDARTLSESEAEQIWDRVANIDRLAATAVRMSAPLSSVARLYDDAGTRVAGCVAAADLGTGIVRIAFEADSKTAIDTIRSLRVKATAAASHLFIERCEAAVRSATDAWGDVGATAGIMQAIKTRFDPRGLLNPGRFVAGI